MSEKIKVTKFYSDLSKSYDKMRLGSLRDRMMSDLQVEWTLKNLPQGSFCLEIGCGTGRVTQNLVKKVESLVASDGSRDMIKLNRLKMGAEEKPKVDYVLCDASYLPFRSECFSGVVGGRVFWHVPNYVTAFREVMRVLKVDNPVLFDFPSLYGHFSFYSSVLRTKHAVLTEYIGKKEIRKIFKDYKHTDIDGNASFLLFFANDKILKNNLIRSIILWFEKFGFSSITGLFYAYYMVRVVK